MSKSEVFVDLVEAKRKENNTLWMDILRVALKHAPAETKAILRKINVNDNHISALLAGAAEED